MNFFNCVQLINVLLNIIAKSATHGHVNEFVDMAKNDAQLVISFLNGKHEEEMKNQQAVLENKK